MQNKVLIWTNMMNTQSSNGTTNLRKPKTIMTSTCCVYISIQTFCSMRPSSSGKWAPMYQSPGAGLERLKVVELCDVTGRIRDRQGLHSVAFGNFVPVGFITGGAPY